MGVVKLKVSDLEQADFERYPVWVWAEEDDEDLVEPVLETDPIPADSGAEFIRAEFYTPSGLRFDGYVVGSGEVFAISLWHRGKKFIFNQKLKDFAERNLAELGKAMGSEDVQIFPLTYNTHLRLAGHSVIAGVFDVFADKA